MATINIVFEPAGSVYRDLLTAALDRCDSFSLVWRDQFTFDGHAQRLEEELRPWLLSTTRGNRWPGTELLGHSATIRFYRFDEAVLEILASTQGLYSWLAPSRPEDLALYKDDGSLWLGSVAHERDAWLEVSPLEARAITDRAPELLTCSEND